MTAFSSLFCSTRFIPTPFLSTATNLLSPQHNCASFIPQKKQCKREFPLPAVASVPYEPINFEYLQEEFSGHGVTFEEACGSCVVKMELRNGSTVTMMLPSGLITSYKALMWHGGKVELLHTSVSEGENGDPLIQGGVSLNFNFQTDHDGQLSWSPTNWVLHKIHGKPRESIQVCFLMSNSVVDCVRDIYILNQLEIILNRKKYVFSLQNSSYSNFHLVCSQNLKIN